MQEKSIEPSQEVRANISIYCLVGIKKKYTSKKTKKQKRFEKKSSNRIKIVVNQMFFFIDIKKRQKLGRLREWLFYGISTFVGLFNAKAVLTDKNYCN